MDTQTHTPLNEGVFLCEMGSDKTHKFKTCEIVQRENAFQENKTSNIKLQPQTHNPVTHVNRNKQIKHHKIIIFRFEESRPIY